MGQSGSFEGHKNVFDKVNGLQFALNNPCVNMLASLNRRSEHRTRFDCFDTLKEPSNSGVHSNKVTGTDEMAP